MDIVDDGSCFACGRNNASGLKLRFDLDSGNLRAGCETRIADCFSGWKGAVHGGIVAAMLDEAMVYACVAAGVYVATATMSAKFRIPVPVGVALRLHGEVTQNGRKFMRAESRVQDSGGKILAEAQGLLAVMRKIATGDPVYRFSANHESA